MANEQATPEGAKLRHFESSANVCPYHQQLGCNTMVGWIQSVKRSGLDNEDDLQEVVVHKTTEQISEVDPSASPGSFFICPKTLAHI